MLEITKANKEGLNNNKDMNQELSSKDKEILAITKGKSKGKGKSKVVKESLKEQSN